MAFEEAVDAVRSRRPAEEVALELYEYSSPTRSGCGSSTATRTSGRASPASGRRATTGRRSCTGRSIGSVSPGSDSLTARVAVSPATAQRSRCRWLVVRPGTSASRSRVGDVIGREIRAQGGNFFGGVCVNLPRHPAWGRAQETYGDDPYHLGEFGAALTRGAQRWVMACVKHYALNSMENARFTVDVTVDEATLHDVYLPALQACRRRGRGRRHGGVQLGQRRSGAVRITTC